MTRIPTLEDWRRVFKYTTRVRQLVMVDFDTVHEKTLQCWHAHKSGTYILPNLRVLVGVVSNADEANAILPFLTPGVRKLDFGIVAMVPDENPSLAGLCLEKIRLMAPRILTNFTFTTLLNDPLSSTTDALFQAISVWSSLGKLSVQDISLGFPMRAIMDLARLVTLKTLFINCDPTIEFKSPAAQAFFPSLEELTLGVPTFNSLYAAISIIGSIQSRHLHFLRIDIDEAPEDKDIRALLNVLKSHKQLRRVKVGRLQWGTRVCYDDSYVITETSLKPLLTLSSLKELSIMGWPIQITPGFLEQVPVSWPGLEILDLSSSGSINHRPPARLHLQTVETLIQKCMNLQTLGLPLRLDPTSIPKPPVKKLRGESLKFQLWLGTVYDEIKDPNPLAAYLTGLFGDFDVLINHKTPIPRLQEAINLLSANGRVLQ